MVAVSIVACWLGWTVHCARVQRDAVAAIKSVRGYVYYDWQIEHRAIKEGAKPWWPFWLGSLVGDGYFGRVVQAHLIQGATDAEMARLSDLPGLEVLSLHDGSATNDANPVTANGFANLAQLPALRDLDLSSSSVADAFLRHLSGLTKLRELSLADTSITDAGLMHLRGLRGLRSLDLHNTEITDAGLAHLCGMTELAILELGATHVSDVGMVHLRHLTKPCHVYLDSTRVTESGARDLQAALPNCLIYWCSNPFLDRQDSSLTETDSPESPSPNGRPSR
jgi:hypothetical protein